MPITAHDLRRLAAEAVCSDRTARRWYQGLRVTQTSEIRLRRAAETLGLPIPPPQVKQAA
jgi:hypothetical protein